MYVNKLVGLTSNYYPLHDYEMLSSLVTKSFVDPMLMFFDALNAEFSETQLCNTFGIFNKTLTPNCIL